MDLLNMMRQIEVQKGSLLVVFDKIRIFGFAHSLKPMEDMPSLQGYAELKDELASEDSMVAKVTKVLDFPLLGGKGTFDNELALGRNDAYQLLFALTKALQRPSGFVGMLETEEHIPKELMSRIENIFQKREVRRVGRHIKLDFGGDRPLHYSLAIGNDNSLSGKEAEIIKAALQELTDDLRQKVEQGEGFTLINDRNVRFR